MRIKGLFIAALLATAMTAAAAVHVDLQVFGTSLGGWTKRSNSAAEYPLSGATYRTYKPEITPTPDGGLFVSLRIDHVRGWLASDDHAVLEITISASGNIESAQSTIAIQGRSITTDVIRSGNIAGNKLVGTDRAVQIGTDLVADLTAKMLQEQIVEAGRVSYPAVLRHNYNLLFQAIRSGPAPAPEKPNTGETPAPTPPEAKPNNNGESPTPPSDGKPNGGEAPAPAPGGTPADAGGPPVPDKPPAKLEIKPLGEATKGKIPVGK